MARKPLGKRDVERSNLGFVSLFGSVGGRLITKRVEYDRCGIGLGCVCLDCKSSKQGGGNFISLPCKVNPIE